VAGGARLLGKPLSGPEMPVVHVHADALIPTWFRIGGRADRLVHVRTLNELIEAVAIDPACRVLGDGANLLVDDDGVGELVVATTGMNAVEINAASGRVLADAGADLPKLILATGRAGLAGLEGLGGIPATVGGAIVMNAGGAFGQIADSVAAVHMIDRGGAVRRLARDEIAFGYRHSGLSPAIVARVEFQLTSSDPVPLRERLKDVMAYKKKSQPMAADSAGCCFKNPTLSADVADDRGAIGHAGQRVSAGMLIDRAGLKGLAAGGASVSPVHGNFLVTKTGAKARDVIDLMAEIEKRVRDRFGVVLEREVVVWTRDRGSPRTTSP